MGDLAELRILSLRLDGVVWVKREIGSIRQNSKNLGILSNAANSSGRSRQANRRG